jgi:hypothetical protein
MSFLESGAANMSESLFCISHDQRNQVYDALRGIDYIRRRMSRHSYHWDIYATELQTYMDMIARVLNQLAPDPRNDQALRAEPPNRS